MCVDLFIVLSSFILFTPFCNGLNNQDWYGWKKIHCKKNLQLNHFCDLFFCQVKNLLKTKLIH